MSSMALGPKWYEMRDRLWGPNESHGVDSDCPNPYCDYHLTDQDWYAAEQHGGQFQCPNCGWEYNVERAGVGNNRFDQQLNQRTHSGLTLTQMGQIGESVVKEYASSLGDIPGIGRLEWESPTYNDPIDLVLGNYAVEVKTLHSESYPRFKIGGIEGEGATRQGIIGAKNTRTQELSHQLGIELEPAILGVRLNFYTNRADLFWAPGGFKDRRMTNMQYIGQYDFSHLNPFPNPENVPPATGLPEQGWTGDDSDIPF